MAGFNRFGRRVSVPSSLQIRMELRALVADERTRELCAELDRLPDSATWQDIIDNRQRLATAAASTVGIK
jgi:hypothetical protein